MRRTANPALIGAFVVGAVALAVAALVVFGGGKFFRHTQTLVAYFDGSLKGLSVGAPVTFNGVKVGSVTNFKVVVDTQDSTIRTPVFFEIDAGRLEEASGKEIKFRKGTPGLKLLQERGLRAQLELQSLVTGQTQIALNFHPGTPVRLTGLSEDYPEVATIPSSMEKLSRTLETIPLDALVGQVMETVQSINRLAGTPEIKQMLVGMNRAVGRLEGFVQRVDGEVTPLMTMVDTTTQAARATLVDLQAVVARLGPAMETALKDYSTLAVNTNAEVRPLVETVQRVAASAEATLRAAQRTVGTLDNAIDGDSPLRYDLANALKEVQAAARSLHALTDYLERHPEAVVSGKRPEGGR